MKISILTRIMKYFINPVFVLLLLAIAGCKNNQPSNVNKPVTDTVTVQSKTPILDKLLTELDSTEIYDGSLLYGYWFKPHEACAVNIIFHKNGTFEFKYYIVPNDTTIVDVIKKGTFTISNKDAKKTRIIKMVADDGWDKDVFDGTIYYKKNDLNYYLENEKSGLYLVKGSD